MRKLSTSLQLLNGLSPTEPKILFNIGQLHMWARDYRPAYGAFLSAVELDDWFLPAWMQLGFIDFIERRHLLAQERYAQALRCFRKRSTCDWEQLGLMWVGKLEDVVWSRAAASEGDRPCRPCCVPLGAIFRVSGRFAKATVMDAGEGTNWTFAGRGKVVART